MNFEVLRTDPSTTRVVHDESTPRLGPLQARLQVDTFAVTANNVTYADVGEILSYWSFFPTEAPWGRVPAWGFATVIDSVHPDLEVGQRFHGLVPMSRSFTVTADLATSPGFTELSTHRVPLASLYNRYTPWPSLGTDPTAETFGLMLHPQFSTGFLLAHHLADHHDFGAEAVVLTSASSKTAIATADRLRRRGGLRIVGITSAANLRWVGDLGVYDDVVTYADIEQLPVRPCVLIDIAGSVEHHTRLHQHLGHRIARSLNVGRTHGHDTGPLPLGLPGPEPHLFFAPAHSAERLATWGRDRFEDTTREEWTDFLASATSWFTVSTATDAAGLAAAFDLVRRNAAPPDVLQVVALTHPGASS